MASTPIPRAALALLLLVACTPDRRERDPDPDDAPHDAGSSDAGSSDAGSSDGGGCGPALTACDGECVDVAVDPAHCGRCDRACASGGRCEGGECLDACGGCAPGMWCDPTGPVCVSGCTSDADCPQPGRCDPVTHECACAAGTHECGGACVSDRAAETCGARCTPCPGTANGSPTCVDGACGIDCAAGTHECGDRCVPDTSTAGCGSSCSPCPVPANGAATCDGFACGTSCNPGFHACGTACVSNASAESCGYRCAPCPVPANGRATCDGSSCGIACSAGYAPCAGECVPESAAACGATCARCSTAPTNASPACVQGQCAFECNAPYLAAGSSCALATTVAAGGSRSCALVTGGRVRCWATDVPNLTSGVTAISAGDGQACAIRGSALSCWGSNSYGQLGDGSSSSSSASPVTPREHGSTVSVVSVGEEHTCAVKDDGSLRCWGRGLYGRLGSRDENDSRTPVTVYPTGTVSVAAGGGHTCALLANGTVQCWGYNQDGQLGMERNLARDCGTGLFDPYCRTSPVTVAGLSNVVAISAGSDHTCAIIAGGQLKCWGGNRWNQVRATDCTTNTNDYCKTPVDVMSGVVQVSAGNSHTCAVLTGGAVKCWGYNDRGEIGNGSAGHYGAPPFQVFSSGALAVSASQGGYHSCAVLSTGGVKCWGDNGSGQLGDGTRTDRPSPVDVK